MEEVLKVVAHPMIYPGVMRSDKRWAPYRELCTRLGGQPISIGSPIDRGARKTVPLYGYLLSAGTLTTPKQRTLSPKAQSLRKRIYYITPEVRDQYLGRKVPKTAPTQVVLMFPGNGGSGEGLVLHAGMHTAAGRTVYLINPRGFGRSQGRPNADRTHLDVETIVNFAIDSGEGTTLIFEGHSFGAHLALWGATYAAKTYGSDVVRGVLMDRPFATMKGVAKTLCAGSTLMGSAVHRLFPFDNLSLAEGFGQLTEAPLLIVRGTKDHMMNPNGASRPKGSQDEHADALCKAFFRGRTQRDGDSQQEAILLEIEANHHWDWRYTNAKVTRTWMDALEAPPLKERSDSSSTESLESASSEGAEFSD